jgi:hypothetical protein
MLRRMILGVIAIAAVMTAASSAAAQVSVSIGINLPAPPHLVVVPASPVMYAPAVAANYFFYGGQYYVFTNGGWYVGPRHNGPWVVVAPEFIPRPILAVPVRYYRTPPPEWKHWRREGPPQWAPAWGRRWDEEHGRGHREAVRDDRRDDRRDGREGPGGHDGRGRGHRGG